MGLKQVFLPKLGESVMEATIIKWYKKVGDLIEKDENLLEIATDKVDTEIPCPFAGVIKKILYVPDAVVPIGSVIALIEMDENNSEQRNDFQFQKVAENTNFVEKESVIAISEDLEKIHPKIENSSLNSQVSEERFYSPLVLSIAAKEKINLSELEKITGTGENGRVTKKDVLKYITLRSSANTEKIENYHLPQQPPLQTLQATSHDNKPMDNEQQQLISKNERSEQIDSNEGLSNNIKNDFKDRGLVEIIEMSRMRKVIAKNMVESKRVSPHVTSFAEVDVTEIIQWRNSIKANFEKNEGVKLTLTPIFIECLIKSLVKFPILNSSIENNKIIIKKYFNIGMATALPSGDLIVPVIKNAHYLNLVGISHAVNNLSNAARANKLEMEQIEGGTFTLSNIGSFGSLMGTPIILQPQVAILAIGQIKKRAVVIEQAGNDIIAIRSMMYISLSYDHRIIDGALASNFLTSFTETCEQYTKDKY